MPASAFLRQIISLVLFLHGAISFAQVFDDFSDGDFTDNPTWTGNTNQFIISTDFMLASKGDSTGGTNARIYLSTPSTDLFDTQWEFFANPRMATSSNNLIDFYIVSDIEQLTGTNKGYFVRIGGTPDEVALFRKDAGGAEQYVIQGVQGSIGSSSNNPVRVKVTRDQAGQWALYADHNGGFNYNLIGSGLDVTHTTSNFIGVLVKYSNANRERFFIDDIAVGPIVVDNTAPTLIAAVATSANTVQVQFSEAVEGASAQNTANYTAGLGLGNPVSALRLPNDFSKVMLTFQQSFPVAQGITLNISGVKDIAGNTMSPVQTSFTYSVASEFDILINEIMADPDPVVGQPSVEYIELYNRTSTPVDLTGWIIRTNNTNRTIPTVSIAAHGYLVLTSTAGAPLFPSTVPVIAIPSFSAITNSGATLTLLRPDETVISSVSFSSAWYGDSQKAQGGWSLERISPLMPCTGAGNWIASDDPSGGTPGEQNSVYEERIDDKAPFLSGVDIISNDSVLVRFSESVPGLRSIGTSAFTISNGQGSPAQVIPVEPGLTSAILVLTAPLQTGVIYAIQGDNSIRDCAGNQLDVQHSIRFALPVPVTQGDILINELMVDEDPPVMLPPVEYIEVYNNTDRPLNLGNCMLRVNTTTRPVPDILVEPDSFAVLTSIAGEEFFQDSINVVGIASFPALSNSGAEIAILNENGQVVHSVNYQSSWYRNSQKANGGWSLEQISYTGGCPGASNWIASESPTGGTPGKTNSVAGSSSDDVAPEFAGIRVLSADSIELIFTEALEAGAMSLTTSYLIDKGIGTPGEVITPQAALASVILVLENPLQAGIVYTVSVSPNVRDCAGNSFLNSAKGRFSLPTEVNPYQIVINEIMADPEPAVGLPDVEFVELFNRTSTAINLEGFKLQIGSAIREIPFAMIEPDSFLVLTSLIGAELYKDIAPVAGIPALSTTALSNSGQVVTLLSPDNRVISTVQYSSTWYKNSAKANGGWTLEQISPHIPCSGSSNWIASIHPSGGTPGKRNSVYSNLLDNTAPRILRASVITPDSVRLIFSESISSDAQGEPLNYQINNSIGSPAQVILNPPNYTSVVLVLAQALQPGVTYEVQASSVLSDCAGNPFNVASFARFAIPLSPDSNDIVINEILSDPKDGGSDYVELYNRSSKILDLKHLQLGNATTSYPIAPEGYQLFPGEYVLLAKDTAGVTPFYICQTDRFYQTIDFPTANNNSGTIRITRSIDNQLIDRVDYTSEMHFTFLNSTDGVSFERINYDRPSDDITNWNSASSVSGYGTPGYRNSQFAPLVETQPGSLTVSPEVFSPDNDGFDDVLTIGYEFDQPGFTATLTVFDSNGRPVKQLLRNQLLGTSGQLSWNGINEENQKSPIGIYVLYLDAYTLDGKTSKIRKAFVLGGRL